MIKLPKPRNPVNSHNFQVEKRVKIKDTPAIMIKIGKAMIGEDQELGVLIPGCLDLVFEPADQGVQFKVPVFDYIRVVLPEHMLDAIHCIEDDPQNAFPEVIQLAIEDLFSGGEDRIAEVKELFVSEDPFVEPGGILRPA